MIERELFRRPVPVQQQAQETAGRHFIGGIALDRPGEKSQCLLIPIIPRSQGGLLAIRLAERALGTVAFKDRGFPLLLGPPSHQDRNHKQHGEDNSHSGNHSLAYRVLLRKFK
ncbi:hypothetical protein [Luteolibacter ambystomatis]|uniref:hypothetical protein n=1 Tax=Luteolibacter ambystomatis TaxID=2824561 RepID=UPI001CF774FC|nr:hypothetical protein [Luteolibacter ambystomatis]